jgi:hypothetical protein
MHSHDNTVYILIETFDNVNSPLLCDTDLLTDMYLFSGNILLVSYGQAYTQKDTIAFLPYRTPSVARLLYLLLINPV